MSTSMPWLKAIEVLVVVGAGAAFVWWQWRDVTRAQAQSRREREAREAREAREVSEARGTEDSPPAGPSDSAAGRHRSPPPAEPSP